MRIKTLVPLAIGLAVGGMAIKLGLNMVQRAGANQGATIPVVVAAQTIEPTTLLTSTLLTRTRVAPSLVPDGAFRDFNNLAHRVSRSVLPRGSVITEEMLAPPGTQPGLSSRIPDGYRAVAVKVDEASSVAGFITPGSRVDVSAMYSSREAGPGRLVGRIILRNVEVGAVGQSLSATGPDGKSGKLSRSLTLFVRPDDVPTLQMAASRALVHLALRNGRDDGQDEADAKAAKAASFFAGLLKQSEHWKKPQPVVVTPQAPPPPKPEPVVVDVIRGTQLERVVFNSNSAWHGEPAKPESPPPIAKSENAPPPEKHKGGDREVVE